MIINPDAIVPIVSNHIPFIGVKTTYRIVIAIDADTPKPIALRTHPISFCTNEITCYYVKIAVNTQQNARLTVIGNDVAIINGIPTNGIVIAINIDTGQTITQTNITPGINTNVVTANGVVIAPIIHNHTKLFKKNDGKPLDGAAAATGTQAQAAGRASIKTAQGNLQI